jgi:putative component of membrane protein insertase Oxa1/YidC/SpoIIIJ protein YidD
LGSVKGREFLDHLKDSAPWSLLIRICLPIPISCRFLTSCSVKFLWDSLPSQDMRSIHLFKMMRYARGGRKDFSPFSATVAHQVAVCHSVILVYKTYISLVVPSNCRLHGISMLITIISIFW